VEAAAALAQAERLGRLTPKDHAGSLTRLDDLWDQINVVEVDDVLIRQAAGLAARFGLRGYDAVHCASAEQLTDQDLVAATGDGQLLDAWNRLGVATFDPHVTGG
jgi:predicted nucleic acid-binding protein